MMTLDEARKTLLTGGSLADLMEAIGVAANDAWSSVNDILPGLLQPEAIAEQAAFALYRRAMRPIPGNRAEISKDIAEWRRWLVENSTIPPYEREFVADLALTDRQYLRLRHRALEAKAGLPPGIRPAPSERELLREYLTRGLDARDRLILTLHYYERQTMAAIGAVLGESERTIIERHADIIARVRASIANQSDDLVA